MLAKDESSQQILLRSMEADVLVPNDETKADLIDGAMGELSSFHGAHGYYAQGVDHTTALLPEGWETRTFTICNANTNHVRGHCLDIHDLTIAKLAAGRQKDYEFLEAAIHLQLINQSTLLRRKCSLFWKAALKKQLVCVLQRLLQAFSPKKNVSVF